MIKSFQAVGRTGEVGISTWTRAGWDFDQECEIEQWGEVKTRDVKLMTHHPDYDCMEMDYYHAMGMYCMFGAGSDKLIPGNADSQWVFPELGILKNGCSDQVNSMIKALLSR